MSKRHSPIPCRTSSPLHECAAVAGTQVSPPGRAGIPEDQVMAAVNEMSAHSWLLAYCCSYWAQECFLE